MQVVRGLLVKQTKQKNNLLETIVCNQMNIYVRTLLPL